MTSDADTWRKLLDVAGCDPGDRPAFQVDALIDYVSSAARAYRDSRDVHEKLHAAYREIDRLQGEVRTLRALAYGIPSPSKGG